LRLVRALAVEIDEHWVEATRYLNMKDLEEHKKERMRKIEQAAGNDPFNQRSADSEPICRT
jgi:hypothetical protein